MLVGETVPVQVEQRGVLWQCLCCSVYVYPLNYGYHLPVLIEGIILACTARIYYHPELGLIWTL